MSLVFASITPHSPLLIPTIGKDNLKKLAKTEQALKKLEEDLYLSKPDILLVISPHGELLPDAFTINVSPEYETDLREFGDLSTKPRYKGEVDLPYSIRSSAKQQGYPVVVATHDKFDHGTSVPLFYLTPHLPNVAVMPAGFSALDRKAHMEFGYIIKDIVMETTKRVAVIASGELSHALMTEAPAGYNAAGPEFDAKIQELLASHNSAGLLQLDEQIIKDASECGFRAFLILLGILRGVNFTYESYAYEAPFGVGYLTANFVL